MIARPPLSLQARLNGLAWMIGGTAFVLIGLAYMNDIAPPTPAARSSASPITVAPPPPPAPKTAPRPKPRPRPKPTTAPPPPLAALGAGLSGIDVGLGTIDPGELDGDDQDLLGDDEAVVMTADTVDVPPRAVHRVPPSYPPKARAKGVTGEVVLSLLVETDGRVSEVRVESAQPAGLFERAAQEAVRRWRFQPARYQGKPVRVWARQRIRFQLG